MRKILPVLMIGVALASAVDASALTAKDLDGKYYGAYMIGTDLEYELAKEQFGGKFELRNGTLYMVNFWRAFDMPVTVNENSNSITIPISMIYENGNGLYPGANLSFSVAEQHSLYSSYYGGYCYGYQSRNYPVTLYLREHGEGSNPAVDQKTTDNISNDCLYRFATDSYVTATMQYNGAQAIADGNGMRLYVFDTNTKVKEYSGNSMSEYRADIQLDPKDPTKARVKNFADWGVHFTNEVNPTDKTTLDWLNASIDYDKKTFTIEASYIGGDVHISDDSYLGYGSLGGKTGNWYVYLADPTIENYIGCYLTDDGTYYHFNDMVGTITDYKIAHRNVEENYWHKTCGGNLETYYDAMDIEFGQTDLFSDMFGPKATSDRTVYEVNLGYEYTHDVRVQASQLAASDTQLFVKGKILQPENDRHVVSYDLYVVPGHHETINTLAGTDDTHGAAGAQVVVSGLKTDESGSAPFSYYDALPAGLEIRPDRKYSLFVRANYDPDLHLNPTFHSLTSGGGISTGIDTITDEIDEITVAAVPGGIRIEGFEGTVEVYTASGVQVFGGTVAGIISVNPGLYIVRAGKKSVKVRVD